MSSNPDAVEQSVADIKARHEGAFPETALILGSGLGQFGDEVETQTVISYQDIAGFPVSTVAGHAGRLLIGACEGLPLVCMQGRMHLYEGYRAQDLAIPIRTFHRLGVKRLLVTNAAGSLSRHLRPGSLMLIEDHINFSGQNPLTGPNDERYGLRFFDMSQAYDPGLRKRFAQAAEAESIQLDGGVYVQVAGPNFETPAEVRAFGRMGGDAVGMSTVPEVLVANHCGMKAAGVSVITNFGAGLQPHALSHTETMEEADRAYERMSRLFKRLFADLASE